jgi:hypothetical protein
MGGNVLKRPGRFRFGDFLITVFFLSIAALSVKLFWLDLMQTINLQNTKPVGVVVIKKNVVQRRHTDRVLWDRLATESPVYLWNTIRVADDSAATLHVKNAGIDLDENTLIRIALTADGENLLIELTGGNISVNNSIDNSNEGGSEGGGQNQNVFVNLHGKQLQAAPGTVLSAYTGVEGVSVHVSSGSALLVEEDSVLEITRETAVTIDNDGNETWERAAVVTSPAPNARYLKSTSGPGAVNFAWNRMNLAPDEMLKLEISPERDFSRVSSSVEGLSQARVYADNGSWYWRLLSFEGAVLDAGRLTVTDSSGPKLVNPVTNGRIRYLYEIPPVNFQWEAVEEAASYIVEVSDSSDFSTLRLRRQSSTTFVTETIEEGIWFWRVMPVFPDIYSGTSSYSGTSYFKVEEAPPPPDNLPLSQWLALETTIIPPPPQVSAELIPANFAATVAMVLPLLDPSVVSAIPSRYLPPPPPPPEPPPAPRQAAASRPAPARRTAPPAAPAPEVPFPPPQNMRPGRGVTYGFDELKSLDNIRFSWDAVQGANAYVFTLYHQRTSGRVQIFRTSPLRTTSYTLENLERLDNGTFVWQAEAVRIGNRGAIERRGRVGESVFIIDVPAPGQVLLEDTGVLYGN